MADIQNTACCNCLLSFAPSWLHVNSCRNFATFVYVLFILSHRVLLYTSVNISGIHQEVAFCKSSPYVCVLLLTLKNILYCTVSSAPDHT